MNNALSPMNTIQEPLQVDQVVLRMSDGSEIIVAEGGGFLPNHIPTLYSGGVDADGKHQVILCIGPYLKCRMPAMMAATELVEVEQPLIIDKVN